ncbi:MAG: hypothetical protein KKH68_09180 [Proteobacteria bacterium]|nr:hypothetical protein [Pseudomonadota bacterium]
MFGVNKKSPLTSESAPLSLDSGSKVAVIGGGPAGSFFSYFLLDFAERMMMDIQLDIFEPKDFSRFGPAGCNHCGGIISEAMVQLLATEGINLPPTVVQRGIESYVLHTDVGRVKLETPVQEKRIAAIYRGAGPLGTKTAEWGSFDGFLQELTIRKGANHIKDRVDRVDFDSDRPVVTTRSGLSQTYDLVVGAGGINSKFSQLFEGENFDYRPPQATKTFICEFLIGKKLVEQYFGNSMHVFLLDIPRLKFGALIPKGNNVTMCILGQDIDKELVDKFMNAPQVRDCFPPDKLLANSPACKCFPKINIKKATKPFGDRLVLLGDCAVTRLYKDGIGGAYYTAKAAASTAVFHGISSQSFRKYYWPTCRKLDMDNAIGRFIFAFTNLIQKWSFIKRGILRLVAKENCKEGSHRRLSGILWDTFTGSASYQNIFQRTLSPAFLASLTWETGIEMISLKRDDDKGVEHAKGRIGQNSL